MACGVWPCNAPFPPALGALERRDFHIIRDWQSVRVVRNHRLTCLSKVPAALDVECEFPNPPRALAPTPPWLPYLPRSCPCSSAPLFLSVEQIVGIIYRWEPNSFMFCQHPRFVLLPWSWLLFPMLPGWGSHSQVLSLLLFSFSRSSQVFWSFP